MNSCHGATQHLKATAWCSFTGRTRLSVAALLLCPPRLGLAQDTGPADDGLSAVTQNFVGSLKSILVQANLFFGISPKDQEATVTVLQPVLLFNLTEDWNLITWTVVSSIYVPRTITGFDGS